MLKSLHSFPIHTPWIVGAVIALQLASLLTLIKATTEEHEAYFESVSPVHKSKYPFTSSLSCAHIERMYLQYTYCSQDK